MAASYDNTTYNSPGSVTSTSFNHVATGSYLSAVVWIYQFGGATDRVSAVSVGGVSLAKRAAANDPAGGLRLQMLSASGISSGTLAVNITMTTATSILVIVATYAGTDQTSHLDGTGTNAVDPATSVTVSTTTTYANSWVAAGAWENGTGSMSAGTNTTLRYGDAQVANADSAGPRAAGANLLEFTGVGSTRLVAVALGLREIPSPTLDTSSATDIALTYATLNGEVISDGGVTITDRGFVYSTTPTPTLSNSSVSTSGTTGTYSATATGLTPGTLYYVRAYATTAVGTGYGDEISFTTSETPVYSLIKDIGASNGDTFIGRINVTGTTGTITVKLGSTGTSTVINAGAGPSVFYGTYSGLDGLIITRSASFDGTIDDVFYTNVPLGTTIDWDLDSVIMISAIDSSVFFKRIEDKVFNSFTFYRYLDLLFKDLDGYVTVTVRDEREDVTTERQKVFVVGNVEPGTVSPFQKKRISFLIKNQAVIIGLSNANVNETFSIAQFLLTGHKKAEKMFSPSKIISLS